MKFSPTLGKRWTIVLLLVILLSFLLIKNLQTVVFTTENKTTEKGVNINIFTGVNPGFFLIDRLPYQS